MAFSHLTFNKLQDDDLAAALARQQMHEEGKLSILKAQEDQNVHRSNEAIRRDNAETNRVYREGLIEESGMRRESQERMDEDNAEKHRVEVEQKRRTMAALDEIINDPQSPPEVRQQARMQKAGMSVAPFKIGDGKKKVFSHDGKELFEVGEKDVVQSREPNTRPSFTLIQTPEGQFNYDRKTGRMGERVADLAPTATGRERGAAYRAIVPILDTLEGLSEKINVNEGVYATAVGTVGEQAAKVNLDNDIAEYKRILTAMIPMAARAFGHTGVLTQQDVDSAMAAFAQPTDSKALRDRLVATTRNLLKKINSARYAADAMNSADPDEAKSGAIGAAGAAVRGAAPAKPKFELVPD
jgi:hypothetical protein